MKIKRFVAATMREAIRLVREEQGPEAVILSNRRVEDGIEVVAAVDYDEALVRSAAVRGVPPAAESVAADPNPIVPAARTSAPDAEQAAAPLAAPPAAGDRIAIQKLRGEISSVRKLIETQLAALTLGQFRSTQWLRASVLREMARLGLEMPLAREIATALPDDADEPRARTWPLQYLSQRLPIVPDDPLEQGGVYALIGPTGVGKTTTLAKLAARFAARHGIREVALISMDHYRIGAQDQLFTYGRRLGVPVYTADNAAALAARLDQLSDCKLVLIDTAGLSPRDARLPEQLAELQVLKSRPVRTYLVLAANSQASDLEQAASRFHNAALAGAVLTKLDETTRLGGALSVLIRRELPLAYVCDGQRVPEDLRRADAKPLVVEAVRLVRAAGADANPMDLEEEIDAAALACA